MKWRFAVKFLLAFALLMALWWRTDFGALYRSLVIILAAPLSAHTNGWTLQAQAGGAVFQRGHERMDLLLQLPALSMGLMPLLSLILATPGQGRQLLLRNIVLGIVLYIAIDVLIVLVYPFILDRPGFVKDTLGVFSGLVGIVVAPLGLWFALTYSALRPVWQIVGDTMAADAQKPQRGAAPRKQSRKQGR